MIYLDHNASNPPDPRVLAVFERGLREAWANPSSLHGPGRAARACLEQAREEVAALAGVPPAQVTFTASGTEALNQALTTVVSAGPAPTRVVASAVEHPAVLRPLEEMAREGAVQLALAPVDGDGRVDVAALARLLTPGTALVAVMAAQNEVGTVQPLEQVGRACAAAGVPLLVDASQAVGRIARRWEQVPWDYLVLSAHKLRAPRGAAALVHRGRALPPAPLILGGSQERGRRAGTEPVAAIMALGEACRLARAGDLLDPDALRAARDRLEASLLERLPRARILAQGAERLPQTTALLLPGVPTEPLLVALDLAGVYASSGSACASGALEPSRALAAMGIPPAEDAGRLRLSFGPETREEDLDRAVAALAEVARGG